ncbi:MAG TPA: DMT family protein [Chitinophagaceae bacterium]|nr:DMT family protein [Chitinophagaceae bacterium]
MRTVLLLFCSNIFMTIAWYGHLKFENVPLWKVIIVSWGIAFLEYCFQVPANRIGFMEGFNGFQLKLIQEVITLIVFTVFAVLYLKEHIRWNYLASFGCMLGAVYFMFMFKK